jgi:hypothetical protein
MKLPDQHHHKYLLTQDLNLLLLYTGKEDSMKHTANIPQSYRYWLLYAPQPCWQYHHARLKRIYMHDLA